MQNFLRQVPSFVCRVNEIEKLEHNAKKRYEEIVATAAILRER
jgi:hypothetical protein